MLGELIGLHLTPTARNAIEFFLATPVVLWGGWPFFEPSGPRSSIAAQTCLR